MDNKLDTTPFPADIAEMVLNKDTRHASLQSGPVFVDVTFTDNGSDSSDNMRYRICYVGPLDINGKHYDQLAVSTAAADLRDVAAKLRDGYFTADVLAEAAAMRDRWDAAEAANKARKGAANE